MASITIRNLDAHTKARLRVRAAHRQRSMEEEARNILRTALAEADAAPAAAVARWFAPGSRHATLSTTRVAAMTC